jgi:hypothetical protein
MHLPEQLSFPAGQEVTQMPSSHCVSPVQVVVQSPQWASSCETSTHASSQAVSVPPQVNVQLPALQSGVAPGGAVQGREQPPQFELSAFVSTQEPLQFVVPLEQSGTQAPPLHTAPPPHAVAQAPQWSRSEFSSTQAPPHRL